MGPLTQFVVFNRLCSLHFSHKRIITPFCFALRHRRHVLVALKYLHDHVHSACMTHMQKRDTAFTEIDASRTQQRRIAQLSPCCSTRLFWQPWYMQQPSSAVRMCRMSLKPCASECENKCTLAYMCA